MCLVASASESKINDAIEFENVKKSHQESLKRQELFQFEIDMAKARDLIRQEAMKQDDFETPYRQGSGASQEE